MSNNKMNAVVTENRMPRRYMVDAQKSIVSEINAKLASGKLRLLDNRCLCGGGEDVLVSESDVFGVKIPFYLCKRCGLVRLGKVMDDASLNDFYSSSHRPLYDYWIGVDEYYKHECLHSKELKELLEKEGCLSDIDVIAEMGCGAGGVLTEFANE